MACGPLCRHLELNGVDFPYSRGLSFYEVDDEGKITSARDIPEPTIKPGDSAIYVRPVYHSIIVLGNAYTYLLT